MQFRTCPSEMDGLPRATIHEVHTQQHYMQISYTELHPNQIINTQSTTINSMIPSNKVCILLHWFLLNSESLNTFLWPSAVRQCTQTGQKCRKYMQNLITPLHEVWLPLHTCSTGLHAHLSHWISPKSDKTNSAIWATFYLWPNEKYGSHCTQGHQQHGALAPPWGLYVIYFLHLITVKWNRNFTKTLSM
jgi:hypothetical protein